MSARRPLQPLSPLSANVVGAVHYDYTYTSKVGANVDTLFAMDERTRENDTQETGSIVSGLTSIEPEDDFERLMIQNARDEQRLHDALRGNSIQPFRKARTQPKVGLTLENLERKDAENDRILYANAPMRHASPPSSSGSARSDPAIRPPAEWGRKGRVKRNWLRTVMSDEEQGPGAQEDTIDRLVDDATPKPTNRDMEPADEDVPRPSVEDSPLSRKSSLQGTPASTRRKNLQFERESDSDFTLDFNEASMIASTPYVPRSTVLDDIRQREIESLREQAVTTSRLDRIREYSPEESRPSRPNSSKIPTPVKTNGSMLPTPALSSSGSRSPNLRLQKRTNSWKTIGKSQVVTGQAGEQLESSPVIVYKNGSEPNAQTNITRPGHRREDSQDLLRRLARVSSNTPSPGNKKSSRPQTAPARQSSDSTPTLDSERVQTIGKDGPRLAEHIGQSVTFETAPDIPGLHPAQRKVDEEPPITQSRPSTQPQQRVDIDTTPMPIEPSLLNAKTPVVTGAWVDTPGPRTARQTHEDSTLLSRSPRKASPSKRSPQKASVSLPDEQTEQLQPSFDPTRPHLPGSALEAIVEEARANHQYPRHTDTLGDSTIDSLEDLIAPNPSDPENPDAEEDTLQGLQLPTQPPKNEAERIRQMEVLQLHKMNQRLRHARTSMRDTGRGLNRLEHRIEKVEDNGEGVRVEYRDCPCAVDGGHQCNPWRNTWAGFKHLFYDSKNPKRSGLTWLGIATIVFWVWFISENIAW